MDGRQDGSPSQWVRLGGGYTHDPLEIDFPRGAPSPLPEHYEPSFSAKLTILLAEADNLHRKLMASGEFHLGGFSERNILLNARYMDLLVAGFSPAKAANLGYPDVAQPMNWTMYRQGVLNDKQSRFLSQRDAQVVTSVGGTGSSSTAFRSKDAHGFLTTEGKVRYPGETLEWISSHFSSFLTSGPVGRGGRATLTFRPNVTVQYGIAIGLGGWKTLGFLLDTHQRQVVVPFLGEKHAPVVAETREKLLRAQKLNDRFEQILEDGLDLYSIDELVTMLGGYDTPDGTDEADTLPLWYRLETGTGPPTTTTPTGAGGSTVGHRRTKADKPARPAGDAQSGRQAGNRQAGTPRRGEDQGGADADRQAPVAGGDAGQLASGEGPVRRLQPRRGAAARVRRGHPGAGGRRHRRRHRAQRRHDRAAGRP